MLRLGQLVRACAAARHNGLGYWWQDSATTVYWAVLRPGFGKLPCILLVTAFTLPGDYPVRYAFLCLKEHPYARHMLRELLQRGLEPVLIVDEVSKVSTLEKEKFEKRCEGFELAPLISDQLELRQRVRRIEVSNHNNAECEAALKECNVELVVLGGTRIIKDNILAIPPRGCLNSHPGLLPECRGSASPAWSVYHDIKIGSTCHFIDPGIDTGDIVLRRELPVHRGATYEFLCHATLVLSGVLMGEAVTAMLEGNLVRTPQAAGDWPTFRNAPDDVLASVKDKLEHQTYKHYVD